MGYFVIKGGKFYKIWQTVHIYRYLSNT